MALDWANERYVRLYTRETPDQASWCWQAVALWPWVIARADGAGVIETRKGARGIAALTRLPLEVVEVGLEELLSDGCVCATEGGYILPNYIPAQTTFSSGSRRQSAYRERERAKSSAGIGKDDNTKVTRRDAALRVVTRGDSDPSRSEPSREEKRENPPPPSPAKAAKAAKAKLSALEQLRAEKPARAASVEVILERLSAQSGVQFRGGDAHVKLIASRLDEGRTELQLRYIIGFCASKSGLGWKGDPEMAVHLCPETLFGPRNIERYLERAEAWALRNNPTVLQAAQELSGATKGVLGYPAPPPPENVAYVAADEADDGEAQMGFFSQFRQGG